MITPKTKRISMGPLDFDLEIARAHGWTEPQIKRTWDRMVREYRRTLGYVRRSHPELWKRDESGAIRWIGELP